MSKSVCFTDGASRGNPGSAGWGAVLATPETVTELGAAITKGTNNEAELKAVVAALREADKKSLTEVTIYTDSSYLVKGATKWIYGWQQNGWTTQQDEPVKNQDKWKQIASYQQAVDVTYQHIPAHAGIPANERADDIATSFADGETPELFAGERNDYPVSLNPEPKLLDEAPVYLSLVDGDVRQHENWEACKQRTEGREARYRKVETQPQRRQVLQAWGKSLEDIQTDS